MKANKFIKIHHFKISMMIDRIFIVACLLIGFYYFCTENFRQMHIYEYDGFDIEYIGGHYDCLWFLLPASLWLIHYKYMTPYYYRYMYGITDEDLRIYEQEPFIDD